MPTSITAAVCRSFGAPLSIEELVLDDPGPGEVRVDVEACAVCHSDLIFFDGGWGGPLPAVYGHEAAGVVTAVGAGVRRVAVGDRVVVSLVRSCGFCRDCLRGNQVTCSGSFARDRLGSPLQTMAGEAVGHGLRTAAFATQTVVDASQVVVVDGDVPLDAAALLACGVVTGVGAVRSTAAVPVGSSVVVIGCGGVGLNTVQGAALVGAATIVAVDLAPRKATDALDFGATHALDARGADLVDRVLAVTGDRGADFVFVTVGARPALQQAFALLAPGGAVVLVGMTANGVTIEVDPTALASQNQRVLGSKMGATRLQSDIPELVALYRQGRLQLDELISGRYELETINEAIASMKAGEARRHVITMPGGGRGADTKTCGGDAA